MSRERKNFNFAHGNGTLLDRPGTLERFVQNLLGGYGVLLGTSGLVGAAILHAHPVPTIVLAETGTALLGLSLFHLAHERLLRRYERETMEEILRRIFAETRAGYESLRQEGIERAFTHLPILMGQLQHALLHAKVIRILKTWCPSDTISATGLAAHFGERAIVPV